MNGYIIQVKRKDIDGEGAIYFITLNAASAVDARTKAAAYCGLYDVTFVTIEKEYINRPF